ncbi:MAG: DUF309 domain-containing protein [Candidatus Sericytochromatia bacterium]|nr:DUF309 domain-containing protein [Candidatus Sericytochromatia bacterium]
MTAATHSEFARGLDAFNDQAFFECHDILEGLWLVAPPDWRPFYQGIIQAAAAFVHWQRGETTGIVKLLDSALTKLAPYEPLAMGLDVSNFRLQLARAHRYFTAPTATLAGFPSADLPHLVLAPPALAERPNR